jgi:two-component system NarL family sensor kinase
MPGHEPSPAEMLLDQVPACHWIVDQDCVFERVYGDTLPVFGKPPEDIAGRPADRVLAPPALSVWQERFRRALSGETVSLREERDGHAWLIRVFPLRLRTGAAHAGCVMRDITDFVKADHDLRRTVLGAIKSQEAQRAATARFLHDVVGQNLAALGLRVDLVRMDVSDNPAAACDHLAEIQTLLESIMEQVRNFSYELNPSSVERIGLRPALERLGAQIRERFQGTVRISVDPSAAFQPNIASSLYRIAEEAAANAAHHSGCSLIEIAVHSDNGVRMEVRDNGRGFDPRDLQEIGKGLGLFRMEHHAAEAGLRLSISSSRQSGTVVRAASLAPAGGQPC